MARKFDEARRDWSNRTENLRQGHILHSQQCFVFPAVVGRRNTLSKVSMALDNLQTAGQLLSALCLYYS